MLRAPRAEGKCTGAAADADAVAVNTLGADGTNEPVLALVYFVFGILSWHEYDVNCLERFESNANDALAVARTCLSVLSTRHVDRAIVCSTK